MAGPPAPARGSPAACCPPDSWCGNSSRRRSGSGSETDRSSSTAVAAGHCRQRLSGALAPLRQAERRGSAPVSARPPAPGRRGRCLLPRTPRSSAFETADRSRPSKRIDPARTRPGGGTRPSVASAVRVLPDPDSPTRPTISDRSTSSETPRTTEIQRPLTGRISDLEVANLEQARHAVGPALSGRAGSPGGVATAASAPRHSRSLPACARRPTRHRPVRRCRDAPSAPPAR